MTDFVSKALFIVVDGPDGVGKTTAAEKLAKEIDGLYVKAIGDTPLGKIYRERFTAVGRQQNQLHNLTWMMGVFLEVLEDLIKPALAAGKDVIVDRWFYSTMAYQIQPIIDGDHSIRDKDLAGRLESALYQVLNRSPDVYLACHASIETVKERVVARAAVTGEMDRLDMLSNAELNALHDAYAKGAERAVNTSTQVFPIDCNKEAVFVLAEMKYAIQKAREPQLKWTESWHITATETTACPADVTATT